MSARFLKTLNMLMYYTNVLEGNIVSKMSKIFITEPDMNNSVLKNMI